MINYRGLTVLTLLALLAISLGQSRAADMATNEPKLPNGYTCQDVRAKVAELGYVAALALALQNGASWRQLREARKCLR